MEMRSAETFCELEAAAEQKSSAGWLTLHGESQDIAVRHPSLAFQPFDGVTDATHMRWIGEHQRALVEQSLSGHSSETWTRVDEDLGPDSVAILELVNDEADRHGFWVVIGSWFGRVIGRHPENILSDVVCGSLKHAIKTYADEWEIAPEAAVYEYDARFGRVEGPGIFRTLHDIDENGEGALLLDGSKRELRRSAEDDNIIVETWSNRRWKIHELPSKFEAFGKLKRTIG
jgi:hypothetical protein